MDESLSALIRRLANDACEYCRLPRSATTMKFEIDHIVARQHGGRTVRSNLAFTCKACNLSKGPNIAGFDPATGRLTPLFHPRRHK